jgi:hypothetical protein
MNAPMGIEPQKRALLVGSHQAAVAASMSALGQKQTSDWLRLMSALPSKADIAVRQLDIRFVLGDICAAAKLMNSWGDNIGARPCRAGRWSCPKKSRAGPAQILLLRRQIRVRDHRTIDDRPTVLLAAQPANPLDDEKN